MYLLKGKEEKLRTAWGGPGPSFGEQRSALGYGNGGEGAAGALAMPSLVCPAGISRMSRAGVGVAGSPRASGDPPSDAVRPLWEGKAGMLSDLSGNSLFRVSERLFFTQQFS